MITTTPCSLPIAAGGRLAITIVPGIASETQILIEATLPQLILSSVEVQQLADLCAVITDDLRIWHQGGMEISDVYAQEQMVDRLLPLKRIERAPQRAQTASLAVLDSRVVLTPEQLGAFEIAVICIARDLAWQEAVFFYAHHVPTRPTLYHLVPKSRYHDWCSVLCGMTPPTEHDHPLGTTWISEVVLGNPLQQKGQQLCPACSTLWQQQNQERAEVLQQEADA